MSWDVAYVVPDLTHLRYFGPLSIVLQRESERRGVELRQCFSYTRRSAKYNGLASDKNFRTYCDIVTGLPVVNGHMGVSARTLVTVEHCDSEVACDRRVALAHGYDSVLQHASWLADPRHRYTYVCGDLLYNDERLSGIRRVKHPYPPSLLSLEKHREYATWRYSPNKTVTVFYPDAGMNSVADGLIDALVQKGFDVVVKQRRKHQQVTTQSGRHQYDDTWYPSEAVVLPLISLITVGFGSTAYMDLVEAGVQYVNVDLNNAAHPWNLMRHLERENYLRVTKNDVGHVVESVLDRLEHNPQRLTLPPDDVDSKWWEIIVDARDGDSEDRLDETAQ